MHSVFLEPDHFIRNWAVPLFCEGAHASFGKPMWFRSCSYVSANPSAVTSFALFIRLIW